MKELEKSEDKKLSTQPSSNLRVVLNLIDTLLAGKRFAEMDSKKQIQLLSCQIKVREMQEGRFDESSITFVYDTIESLICKLADARNELLDINKKLERGIDDEYVQ